MAEIIVPPVVVLLERCPLTEVAASLRTRVCLACTRDLTWDDSFPIPVEEGRILAKILTSLVLIHGGAPQFLRLCPTCHGFMEEIKRLRIHIDKLEGATTHTSTRIEEEEYLGNEELFKDYLIEQNEGFSGISTNSGNLSSPPRIKEECPEESEWDGFTHEIIPETTNSDDLQMTPSSNKGKSDEDYTANEQSETEDSPSDLDSDDSRTSLRCKYCRKGFGKRRNLVVHEESVHKKIKRFSCSHCSYAFYKQSHLKRHLNTHTKTKEKGLTLKPTKTPEKTGDRCHKTREKRSEQVSSPKISKSNPGKVGAFPCTSCSKVFGSKNNRKVHEESVHRKIRRFKCDTCGFEFYKSSHLKRHLNSHPDSMQVVKSNPARTGSRAIKIKPLKPPIKCGICSKTFTSSYNRHIHVLTVHQRVTRYTCETCGKGFYEKSKLTQHQKTHDNSARPTSNITITTPFSSSREKRVQQWICEICSVASDSRYNYFKHMKDLHEDAARLRCGYCRKISFTQQNHDNHLLSHKNRGETDSFQCEQCGVVTVSKSGLSEHVKRVHERIRNVQCSHCGKMFFDRNDLRQHLRAAHDPSRIPKRTFGRGSHKCKTCGRGFAGAKTLADHIKREHDTERTLKCPKANCKKVFYRKHYLDLHLEHFHSDGGGRDKKQCPYCEEILPNIRSKLIHIRSSHPDKTRVLNAAKNLRPWDCDYCGRCFMLRETLCHHVRQEHGIEMQGGEGYL